MMSWARNNLRLTLVTETYPPQVNGVSRTLGQLVHHMREQGDEVQVIHPDYGDSADGADHHRVASVVMPFYRDLRLPLPPFGAVHCAVAAFRPDLVHIATEATLGLSVLRYALRRRVPVVSSFHTNFDQYSAHYRVGWARGTIWRYLRWFHNRTRETYVPSPSTIAGLAQRGFERLVLWPRGVDRTLFCPGRPGRAAVRAQLGFGADDVVVGYVSRIAAEKNVDYLAAAFEIVARARPQARFLFVGDGPARPELERRMGPHARFAGYRTGEDLADHYAAADVFAFSSMTETFGNVVLEAMASGLPVVALRAGGVADTVQPGRTGILVEPGAPPEQFAEAVMGYIDDAALRLATGESARAYAVGQSWSAIMASLRERYQAVLDPPVAVGASEALCP